MMNRNRASDYLRTVGTPPPVPCDGERPRLLPIAPPISRGATNPEGRTGAGLMFSPVLAPALERTIVSGPAVTSDPVRLAAECAAAVLTKQGDRFNPLGVGRSPHGVRLEVFLHRPTDSVQDMNPVLPLTGAGAILSPLHNPRKNLHDLAAIQAGFLDAMRLVHTLIIPQFGGSFTTAAVAAEYGRDCTCIELNAAYHEIGKRRMARVQRRMTFEEAA